MALVVGLNSYINVEDADTYFGDRFEAGIWSALSGPEREKALVTATTLLDDLGWVGTKAPGQSLGFPREGIYYDNRVGNYVTLTQEIPNVVLRATCELAYHIASNPTLLNQVPAPKRIKVDVIDLIPAQATPIVPREIKRLLGSLLTFFHANYWIPT